MQNKNCRFYGSTKGCRNGYNCRFNHNNPNSVALCRDFGQIMECKYGSNCIFRHKQLAKQRPSNNLQRQQTIPIKLLIPSEDTNENKFKLNTMKNNHYNTIPIILSSEYYFSDEMLLLYGYCRTYNKMYLNIVPTDLIHIIKCHLQTHQFSCGVVVISNTQVYIGSRSLFPSQQQTCLFKADRSNHILQKWQMRRGGSSKIRFARIRIEQKRNYIRFIAEKVNEIFGKTLRVKSVILAGTTDGFIGNWAHSLFESDYLKQSIKSLVTCVTDLSYGGRYGFNSIIKQVIKPKDDQLIYDMMSMMNNEYDLGLITIGMNQILNAIKLDKVKYVVLSYGYYKYVIKLMDIENEEEDVKFAKNEIEVNEIIAQISKVSEYSMETQSFDEYMQYLCKANGIKLIMVGTHSPVLQQFAKAFYGCVAVLTDSINPSNANEIDNY